MPRGDRGKRPHFFSSKSLAAVLHIAMMKTTIPEAITLIAVGRFVCEKFRIILNNRMVNVDRPFNGPIPDRIANIEEIAIAPTHVCYLMYS